MNDHDYVPVKDLDFDAWQSNLVDGIITGASSWGIPEKEVNAIREKQNVWNAAFQVAKNMNSRTRADVQSKTDARKMYEKSLRIFYSQWLAFNEKVTNSDRERLHLRVRSNARIQAGVPVSFPRIKIDFSTGKQHRIHFADHESGKRAKPKGVYGCEIWMKLGGDVPVNDEDFNFLGVETKSPFLMTFSMSDSGKTAHYRCRWISTRGEPGPWSQVVSAIVTL